MESMLPVAVATEPGAAGRSTNFCGLRPPRLVTPPLLGRAETSVAIVTCPAAFLMSKLVGCGVDVDDVEDAEDVAAVDTIDCGGAGAIFVGVLTAALRTNVTLPPANLAPPCLPARRVVLTVVVVPPLATVATATLPTTRDCPYCTRFAQNKLRLMCTIIIIIINKRACHLLFSEKLSQAVEPAAALSFWKGSLGEPTATSDCPMTKT